ncbi:hypothetical protein GCM10022416_43020 [Actinomadura keratinilytica]|uniref:Uncharacterized protein n=1 Tax=Actinomadura keratinilytica TaxID=547461 RepID=A0ABP7ZA34_9ACTN
MTPDMTPDTAPEKTPEKAKGAPRGRSRTGRPPRSTGEGHSVEMAFSTSMRPARHAGHTAATTPITAATTR